VLLFETDRGVRSTVAATKRGERIAIDSTPEELGEEPVRLELANEGGGDVRVGAWSVVRPEPAYRHARVEPEGASRLERPNVVIYLVDALRADYLSVYGWPAPTSPRLETFAAESVVFTDAWAQASWTRPTTASIFTGLHPSTHHSANERQKLDASLETIAERLTKAGYVTGAFVGNHVIGGRFGLDQGFETWNEGDKELYGAPARVLGERALSWLDGRVERNEPFFLYVHTMEPHSPYEPDDEHVAPFRVEEYRGNRDTEALLRLGQLGELEPEGMTFLKTQYQGEIRQNDAAFGSFLDGLRDRGLLDRTLVIFTADHGEEFIEHGGTGHGKTLYQEVVRIPLIIRPPGGAAAALRATGVVEQIDLLPTILGYLDIDWTDALPGRDLSSTLEGGEPSKMPEVVFSEERFGVVEKYSARTRSMKLILNNDGAAPGSRFELYDLASDPRERTNLIESHPVTRSFLQRELDAFRQRESTQGLSDADTELELTPDELDKLRALGYVQ
jgi:arylsulfatase A-like enzyme